MHPNDWMKKKGKKKSCSDREAGELRGNQGLLEVVPDVINMPLV